MEGKVDPVHQLFPRVHVADASGNNVVVEAVDGQYRTPRGLSIVADAVTWIATRSGGPGGQHANTSDTAVTVTIDVERAGLRPTVRDRVVARVGSSISASSAASRSQFRNRAAAWAAAMERLDEAAKPPPRARRATRPSAGAVERRLESKRRAAERKRTRRKPVVDE